MPIRLTAHSSFTKFRKMSPLVLPVEKSGFRAWVHSARPAFNSAADYYGTYAATFGYTRGASLLLTSRRASRLGQRTEVMLPGTDIPLTLRLGTSDISVFKEIFIDLEYGWVFNTAPRVIVDVGGYTGMSAAFFAYTYPEATVIAIEPDAQNYELLLLNTARFPNVHTVRAAVWKESGTISLTDPGFGAWGLQVSESNAPVVGGDLIRAVTIDEIRQEFNLDRIHLLKVDVEGSEKEIFSTADSWLSSVDAICIELHDRFKIGCSRSFFTAVQDFPIELHRNEDVLVARADSQLIPVHAVN
jgi:FkbM family methyltransferase